MYLVRSGVLVIINAPALGRILRPDAGQIDAAVQKCKGFFCTAAFFLPRIAAGPCDNRQAAGSART
jgi:hypothetical protein